MKTVADLLSHKGSEVWSVQPDSSVYEAIETMAKHYIGAVPVLDGGKLVGILSERDYARKVILTGRTSKGTPVKDIMTTKVFCVAPERSIEECMAIMTGKKIRHLPVVEGGTVKGIISIGDVVRSIIEEKQFMIEQLEKYISGS